MSLPKLSLPKYEIPKLVIPEDESDKSTEHYVQTFSKLLLSQESKEKIVEEMPVLVNNKVQPPKCGSRTSETFNNFTSNEVYPKTSGIENSDELPPEIAQCIEVQYTDALLMYGSEAWTGNESEISKVHSVEMDNLKSLNDIAGLEEVKQSLREAIIFPKKYPHLFTKGRSVWSRALLFGAPGVGKTALAHAIAAEAKLPLYQVSCADLVSPWTGHTEKLVRRVFRVLGSQHCILLLDEVDALCRRRSPTDSAHCRRAATELLIQMQHYEGSSMFLLCCTNCPWEIDPAFLRRFQQRIFVPLPEYEARQMMIASHIEDTRCLTESPDWEKFIQATEGLTGSDIRNLVRSALMLPLRELQTCTLWRETQDGKMVPANDQTDSAIRCSLDTIPDAKVWCRPIQMSDLWCALHKADRTVTESCLKPFTNFMKDHEI